MSLAVLLQISQGMPSRSSDKQENDDVHHNGHSINGVSHTGHHEATPPGGATPSASSITLWYVPGS